ncbi:MAG: nucleotidyltransferase family protein [Parcubacteria group bacterium]|nr:nucleotidyltransferase family protein [Parcubacteria group bacterium]
MKTIILAGGKATRLPISAKNKPKALVEIGNKAILQHQIELLSKHGFNDIRISLGRFADQIIDFINQLSKKLPFQYDYVIEKEPLGTGGAIKFASKDIDKPFLALNGDVISDINLKSFTENYQNVSRETKNRGSIAVWHCQKAKDFGLINFHPEKKKILNFLEKPQKECIGYINTGYYILHPDIFKNVSRETFSIEREIFPNLAKNGHLIAFIHNGYWSDLGTEIRLERGRKMLKL